MHDFTGLKASLTAFCRRGPVYYLPNPGNWGDALIRAGTLRLFEEMGLQVRELNRGKSNWIGPFLRGGSVIYGGGGGWCRHWNHARHFVSRLAWRFPVLVLPSTFEQPAGIPKVRFFRRDRDESREAVPDAPFCHDLALNLRDALPSMDDGSGTGFFLRTDAESAERIPLPKGNRDLSSEGTHLTPIEGFFRAVGEFREIHTDRLHVAIAGCLLEREVHLYPGVYFKNRAVFQASLKGYFPRVHFHEDFAFLPG